MIDNDDGEIKKKRFLIFPSFLPRYETSDRSFRELKNLSYLNLIEIGEHADFLSIPWRFEGASLEK